MTTVGYGDLKAKTHLGRLAALVACGVGLLLISFMTVTFIRLLNFNSIEARSFEEI